MFAKLSTVCIAGALIMVAGSNVQAQDFWGNWGARPAYAAAPVRHTGLFGMGILPVGPTVNSSCPNGQCGTCPNGVCATGNCPNGRCPLTTSGYSSCPNGQCSPSYGYGVPYRNTTYVPAYRPTYPQPAYRTPAYNTGFNGYQPAVRPLGYNGVNSPFYN